MSKGNIHMTSKLAAVAIAVVGAGALAVAPAQAAPGNCEQWGFTGLHNIKLSTGPVLTFYAEGPKADMSLANDNRSDNGHIGSGGVEPNGVIFLNYISDTYPDDPWVRLIGDVTADRACGGSFNAKQNGTWELTTPLKCLTRGGRSGRNGRSGGQLAGGHRRRRRTTLLVGREP